MRNDAEVESRARSDRVAVLRTVADPVTFARTFLRSDLWGTQENILRAIATNPRVAAKSCHASGKTFVGAVAALWWLTRYGDGIVITTAPSWTQVERVLWGEIHRLAAQSKIAYPPLSQTSLKLGPQNYAIGLSTDLGVRFQGYHGRVLVILDEAPGIRPDIFEAIEGIRAAGEVRVLALGNPTIASGPFYDAFSANREGWKTFTISAFDTPNLAGLALDQLLALSEEELDRVDRSYLVTRRWVREKYFEWGPGHALWQARVLGEFPIQGDDALISLAWLERASARDPVDNGGPVHAGLDVAGPGEDETVLVVREGSSILEAHTWSRADARGDVAAALAKWRRRLEAVNVDSVGIGYYMAQHLRDLDFPVVEVNVGERASDAERYRNRKAEYYWGLRMRLQEADLFGLRDERAIAQLVGIRYGHNARGQIEIESKEDARKRGVKSPDRAEAVMLAFASATSVTVLESDPLEEGIVKPLSGYDVQLRAVLDPFRADVETCGSCENNRSRSAGQGRCGLRLFNVRDVDAACDFYEPKSD